MGFKCERCGQCCSDPSLIITITHRDILRLEFFLPDTDILNTVTFYQVQDDDPSLEKRLMSPAIITNRGKIFLGLQQKEDKCIFLEDNKCQIYEYRPQICRCFPYTFQVRKDQIYWGYSEKAKEICPAIKKESKIDTAHLENLASEMLKESEEFEQLIRIWNYLAKNNLINPTVQLLLQFITGKIKLSIENLEGIKE
ncbi:MAG: YkgJ family cysteine cluster protein [Candidatus Helarchaeota archaeon]|nr:YkgJ family cysteine cluster protein [Candidatus Helarchaeota archaeon]